VLKKSHNQLIRFILFAGIMFASIGCQLAEKQSQPASLSGKKEIPKITFRNLSPPYMDYDYFRDVKKYGFQSDATSYNLINPGGWQRFPPWCMRVKILSDLNLTRPGCLK